MSYGKNLVFHLDNFAQIAAAGFKLTLKDDRRKESLNF